MVFSDYGKSIYKASCHITMLNKLIDCIKGYKSLYTKVGKLQRDIFMNNLIINEDDLNLSWLSFLTDLDLAINNWNEKPLGAIEKTGIRTFMSIGMLWDKHHFLCTILNHFSRCSFRFQFISANLTKAGLC